MIGVLSLLFSLAILYFVVRYRVHVSIRVSYDDGRNKSDAGSSRSGGSRVRPGVGTKGRVSPIGIRKGPASNHATVASNGGNIGDIISALVNLGCSKSEARIAAERAMSKGPGDLEELLRRAIQEARAA